MTARLPIKRSSAGFTLAELLIVVGILLVLMAIAIPIFAGSLKNAEEATCAANRRSLVSMYFVKYTFDKDKSADAIFTECVEDMKAENDGTTCPVGGTYSIKSNSGNGNVVVQCTKHGLGLDENIYQWVSNTFGGKWGDFTGEDGKKYTVDAQIREQYAKQNGLEEWPSVKGTGKDGVQTDLYLEFKSYGNSVDTTFLYAGANKDPKAADWTAYYICDNTGLLGPDSKGQWYQITSNSNGEGIAKDKNGILGVLEKNKDNKVTLRDGAFVSN